MISSFHRSTKKGGGSGIFVKDLIKTKKTEYLQNLGRENTFELSAIELPDFNLILICIYRSPDGVFNEFLLLLESVINIVQSKGFDIFLCGDWNINFKKHSQCLLELQNILLMHNLINTVNSPARITANISTQIDVMITGLYCNVQTVNYDLGYSDHFAQLSSLMVDTSVIDPKFTMKRQFSENAINEFLNYLQTEPWDHILAMDNVNDSFNTFMNTFLYYFNITFPLKKFSLNKKKQ